MTVTIFRSDDASAPSYTGVAGSIIGLLDACLVSGYGAKTALGWAKEFSGTNLAVYRAASGNRFRLRVDDTSASQASLRGYESMTAVSTGTQLFPTYAQVADASPILLAKGSGGTARSWILIGSATAFYLYLSSTSTNNAFGSANNSSDRVFFFGDLVSYRAGDAYATLIAGSTSVAASNDNFGRHELTQATYTATPVHYVARAFHQLGGSITVAKRVASTPWMVGATLGVGGTAQSIPVPDPISGEILFSPIDIWELNSFSALRRGRLPGAWNVNHPLPFSAIDTVVGSGDLSGKSLFCLPVFNGAASGGFLVEISPTNAW